MDEDDARLVARIAVALECLAAQSKRQTEVLETISERLLDSDGFTISANVDRLVEATQALQEGA